jgi:signal transduction histidine kinase
MSLPMPPEAAEESRPRQRRTAAPGAGGGMEDPIEVSVERILANWERWAGDWMVGREEAAQALSDIARALGGVRSGNPPDLPAPSNPILYARLAETLREEMLRTWGGPDRVRCSPESLLDALAAIDRYRAGLWSGGDADLARRLLEPDAFELVIELAHDLRSPLNSILFLSEVLRSGHSGSVNDHQRSQLGLMYSATLGLISVVSDVMELASDRRGADEEPSVAYSIGRVFESVQEMVRPMAEEKRLSLEFRLPDYDQVIGHPTRLARVLLNLTTNALKFTEDGGVTVAADRLGANRIEFSVSDTGRGISEEQLGLIFQPFRKSEYRKGHFFSGSGLGLSIARRLVRTMGSELAVQTEVGRGSRFSFPLDLPPAPHI